MVLKKRTAFLTAFVLAAFGLGTQTAFADDVSSSGTGFFVNDQGWVVTNAHVVEGCTSVSVPQVGTGDALAIDKQNDLAAFKLSSGIGKPHLPLRRSQPRLGEDIAAYGFPLDGILSDSIKVTTGNINSLVGMENDTRYLQVSTPLQPGNSGGPILDQWGSVVGVSTAVLGTKFTDATGIAAQNVNFAVRSNVVELFLQSRDIKYDSADPGQDDKPLSTADLSDKAVPAVVKVLCHGTAIPQASTPEPPSTSTPAPTVTASERWETKALAFVLLYNSAWSLDNATALAFMSQVYRGDIRFYGKLISADEVLKDKRRFAARWPERQYRVRENSVAVNCQSSICEVSGIVDWYAHSTQRGKTSTGSAMFDVAVDVVGNNIISETGKVLGK